MEVKRKNVKLVYFADLPEDLRGTLVNIRKLIKNHIDGLMNEDKWKCVKRCDYCQNKLLQFLGDFEPHGDVGFTNLWELANDKYEVMIQLTPHMRNPRNDETEENLHKFIHEVFKAVSKEVKEKYDMRMESEGDESEGFEGFDIYLDGEEANYLWEYFSDIISRKYVEFTDVPESVFEYYFSESNMSFDVFLEKPELKYDHRLAIDADTGHRLHIVYSLDGIILDRNNVVRAGKNNEGWRNQNQGPTGPDGVELLKLYGNTDHQSHHQKVLAIIDLYNNKRLTQANTVGPFGYGDKEIVPIKVGEIDDVPSFKSTVWAYDKRTISSLEGHAIRGRRAKDLIKIKNYFDKKTVQMMKDYTPEVGEIVRNIENLKEEINRCKRDGYYSDYSIRLREIKLRELQDKLDKTKEKESRSRTNTDRLRHGFKVDDFMVVPKDVLKEIHIIKNNIAHATKLNNSIPEFVKKYINGVNKYITALNIRLKELEPKDYLEDLRDKNVKSIEKQFNEWKRYFWITLLTSHKITRFYIKPYSMTFREEVQKAIECCNEVKKFITIEAMQIKLDNFLRDCKMELDKNNKKWEKLKVVAKKQGIVLEESVISESTNIGTNDIKAFHELANQLITTKQAGKPINKAIFGNFARLITSGFLKEWAPGYQKLEFKIDTTAKLGLVQFKTPAMTPDFVERFIDGRETLSGFLHRNTTIKVIITPEVFDSIKSPADALAFFENMIRYYSSNVDEYAAEMITEIKKLGHELQHLIKTTKLRALVTMPLSMLFVFDDVKVSDRNAFKYNKDDIKAINDFVKSITSKYNAPEKEKEQIIKDMKDMVRALQESTEDMIIPNGINYLAESVREWYNGGFKKERADAQDAFEYESTDHDWHRKQQNGTVQYLQEKFGVKKLKKLPRDIVSYITIEAEAIETPNDKMMIASYCLGKLEIVEWYIELIDCGSKKYIVPHDRQYLVSMRTQLLACYKRIMDTPTQKPGRRPIIDIEYPKGYEG